MLSRREKNENAKYPRLLNKLKMSPFISGHDFSSFYLNKVNKYLTPLTYNSKPSKPVLPTLTTFPNIPHISSKPSSKPSFKLSPVPLLPTSLSSCNTNNSTSLKQPEEKIIPNIDIKYPIRDIKKCLKLLYEDILNGKHTNHTEEEIAKKHNISLLFGEVLPEGVSKMLDKNHLNAEKSEILIDVGSGLGKLAFQAFFEFPNLKDVIGIEFCASRFQKNKSAFYKFYQANSSVFKWTEHNDILVPWFSLEFIIHDFKTTNRRKLEIRNQNMFNYKEMNKADIIICETDIHYQMYPTFIQWISNFKSESRILFYMRLMYIRQIEIVDSIQKIVGFYKREENENKMIKFKRLFENDSRFVTTWSPITGYIFECWTKLN